LKLVLGTVQFGLPYGIANQVGQVSLAEGTSILQLATACGIYTLDTAIAYGESEQRLGQIGVKGWQIVSKLPPIPDGTAQPIRWVETEVASSLQNLNVSSLYGLLLHRPLQLLEQNGDQIYHGLQEVKKAGIVKKIGVSIYDPEELEILCDRFQFDLVQAPFNIIDHRLIETGWMRRLAEHGIELHVRSVFLQGLLLMKSLDRPHKFNRWSTLFSRWDKWIQEVGLTPQEACLRYVHSFPQISKIVVGVDSANQLQELSAATQGVLPEVPSGLFSTDSDLLNPANWNKLVLDTSA